MRRGYAAAGLALVAVGARLGRRSGVSDEEAAGQLPGDDLVLDPDWQSTRGITIKATPEAIWPWLVQMGFPTFRAGWYTPYWLDRLLWRIDVDSSDRIRPELQALAVGDEVPDSSDWSVFFTVAELEPERALVLHSSRHLLWPMKSVNFSWAFVLAPVSDTETRLLIRSRGSCAPRAARVVVEVLIGPADFVNAMAMLRGIKRRVEATNQVCAASVSDATDEDALSASAAVRV